MMEWINFILFVGVLFYFLKGPLLDFLGDRSEKIRLELGRTASQRKETEARWRDYQRRLETAGQAIAEIKRELQQEGESERKRLVEKAQRYAEKIREDAKKMTEQELRKARHLLKRKTFLLSVDLAKKRLEQELGPSDQERLARWGIQHLAKGEHASIG